MDFSAIACPPHPLRMMRLTGPGRSNPGDVCRWLAYSGSPILLEELLYKPENSLIVQSLHSQLGAETTNGDGFGVGWYGDAETPAVFHSIEPAWNDRNLHELSGHLSSGARLRAHPRLDRLPRAADQLPPVPPRTLALDAQRRSSTPSTQVKRDLALAVDPPLYPEIEGTTDTEMLFHLALTYGLEEDPPRAVERAVGLRRGDGQRARHRAPDADDRRDDRRREHLGVQVLERGASRVRSSTARMSRLCARNTRTIRCCTSSPMNRGSSSRSRSAISPEPGTRFPSRATA